jgi:hypothetical protein
MKDRMDIPAEQGWGKWESNAHLENHVAMGAQLPGETQMTGISSPNICANVPRTG